MKKLLASLLALTLVFGSAVSTGGIAVLNDTAITASAETQYGNDFEYEVDEYGALWIRDYVGNDKEVVIPNNINGSKVVQLISLGNNNVITSVTIPSTVEYIDPVAAFHSCSNLNTINVDDDNLAYSSVDGVLYDKAQKFLVNCPTAKDKVTVPKGVTNIGDYAFNTCTNLEAISLQEGLVCIGDQSFFHCEKLKSINLPNGVEYIGKGAFSQCGNLKNITLPDSIKGINDEAFFQCAGLTEIKLPENLIDIGSLAFADCSLKQITIPKSAFIIVRELIQII